MATITCQCGTVRVDFPVETELFRHECCCHDCISALWYATERGGPQYPTDLCADCCWLPNDFDVVSGLENIGAFMNYADADSTRFYCTACWTVLFADHPFYENRIVVSQIASYREFEGLSNVKRIAPQGRHFLCDRSAEEKAALPPWNGAPSRLYDSVAEILIDSFPAMKEAGGEGATMNVRSLLAQIGEVFIPSDAPRLTSGALSYARQNPMQEDDDQ